MRTTKLMLDGQAQSATEQDVRAVITPAWNPENPTYQPVDYNLILDIIQTNAYNLGFDLVSQEYALSHDQQRMFGTMAFDVGHPDYALNFAFRGLTQQKHECGFCGWPLSGLDLRKRMHQRRCYGLYAKAY